MSSSAPNETRAATPQRTGGLLLFGQLATTTQALRNAFHAGEGRCNGVRAGGGATRR